MKSIHSIQLPLLPDTPPITDLALTITVINSFAVPGAERTRLRAENDFSQLDRLVNAAVLLFLVATVVTATAQTATPHNFGSIKGAPAETIEVTLTGSVSNVFRPYFDLYQLETSKDLRQWEVLPTLLRTNLSTNALTIQFGATSPRQYYRIFTNHLITPLPRPTGPEVVGRTLRLFTDPSRTNRYGIKTNSSFLVSLWYPAQARPGALPGLFDEPQLLPQWDDFAGQSGFGEKIVRSFVSHSYLDASMPTNSDLFPVLIFSPGANSRANYHSDSFEDLASHGYIVLAIDHSAAGGVVFDGKVRYTSEFNAGSAAEANPVLADRVQDFKFVLDDLSRLNATDPILAGKMDLGQIGTFGFSFGAGVAAEFCRIDARCKAVAVLEGYLQGADQLKKFGVGKPVLSLYVQSGDKTLFNKATADAIWLGIKNTEHADFSAVFLVTEPGVSRREPPLIEHTYLISFFNKYLKTNDDHFTDSAPAIFPRVTGFLRK
jgi:dienelactone hydrolase